VHNFTETRAAKIYRLFIGFKKINPMPIYFFERGDFYEMYYGDAIFLSQHVDLQVKYYENIPICRIPIAGSQDIINKILKDQYEIGICERAID